MSINQDKWEEQEVSPAVVHTRITKKNLFQFDEVAIGRKPKYIF